MWRTMIGLVLGVALLGSAACGPAGSNDSPPESCATVGAVQNDRRFTEQDLPGIGEYVELHWLARAQGNPCSRVPGPTDVQYFGIARLRPADADTLRAAYDWATPGLPPQIPPELTSYAPASPAWLRSPAYPATVAGRGVALYLEPTEAVAFFILSTS